MVLHVYQRIQWQFGSICFEQAATNPSTCQDQDKLTLSVIQRTLHEAWMQWMGGCWTGCSLSMKFNECRHCTCICTGSRILESVLPVDPTSTDTRTQGDSCCSVAQTFTAGNVFLWQNVAYYELWCQYFVPIKKKQQVCNGDSALYLDWRNSH